MKPTLGHPSRIAAIRALRAEGRTETEIAALLGIRPNTVTAMESRARKRMSYGKGGAKQYLRIGGITLADLSDAAEDRGTTVTKLAQKLLVTIARDDLVHAILDEEPLK